MIKKFTNNLFIHNSLISLFYYTFILYYYFKVYRLVMQHLNDHHISKKVI